MKYGVVVFSSTHSAIAAQNHLKPQFKISIMPTPRAISASCGISIRFSLDDLEAICAVMKTLKSEQGCYEIYEISNDTAPLRRNQ